MIPAWQPQIKVIAIPTGAVVSKARRLAQSHHARSKSTCARAKRPSPPQSSSHHLARALSTDREPSSMLRLTTSFTAKHCGRSRGQPTINANRRVGVPKPSDLAAGFAGASALSLWRYRSFVRSSTVAKMTDNSQNNCCQMRISRSVARHDDRLARPRRVFVARSRLRCEMPGRSNDETFSSHPATPPFARMTVCAEGIDRPAI